MIFLPSLGFEPLGIGVEHDIRAVQDDFYVRLISTYIAIQNLLNFVRGAVAPLMFERGYKPCCRQAVPRALIPYPIHLVEHFGFPIIH